MMPLNRFSLETTAVINLDQTANTMHLESGCCWTVELHAHFVQNIQQDMAFQLQLMTCMLVSRSCEQGYRQKDHQSCMLVCQRIAFEFRQFLQHWVTRTSAF